MRLLLLASAGGAIGAGARYLVHVGVARAPRHELSLGDAHGQRAGLPADGDRGRARRAAASTARRSCAPSLRPASSAGSRRSRPSRSMSRRLSRGISMPRPRSTWRPRSGSPSSRSTSGCCWRGPLDMKARVEEIAVRPDEAGLRLDRWFRLRFPGGRLHLPAEAAALGPGARRFQARAGERPARSRRSRCACRPSCASRRPPRPRCARRSGCRRPTATSSSA